MRGVVTGSGCLQRCRLFGLSNHTCLSKLRDISKSLCYLGIVRRDANSQNLSLAKLHCLDEPWLPVNSSIHRPVFCCFLDNHSRFPQSSCFCVPWLRCTCGFWLILFVGVILIFIGVILINFLFSWAILIPVFNKGWYDYINFNVTKS